MECEYFCHLCLIVNLLSERRCLTWEGDWGPDIVAVASERGRRGLYGKIILTVSGEVWIEMWVMS